MRVGASLVLLAFDVSYSKRQASEIPGSTTVVEGWTYVRLLAPKFAATEDQLASLPVVGF